MSDAALALDERIALSDDGFMLDLSAQFTRVREELRAELLSELRAELGTHGAQSPFMTIKEAADYLRCDRQRVYDLLSSRRLPRVKEGTRVLIRRDDIDAYLNANGSRSR
jgi:excisionase family DNA binding protein